MNNIDTNTIKKIIIILVILVVIISTALICLNIFQNDNSNIHELIDKYKVEDNNSTDNDININNEQNNNLDNHGKSIKNNNENNNISNNKQENNNETINSIDNNSNYYYENSKKEQIAATKEYYCIEDSYTLKNYKCYKTVSMDSTYRYTCSEGKLNVDVCEYQSTIEFTYYTEAAKEICSSISGGQYNSCVCTKSGGSFYQNGKCYKTKDVKKNATKEYYCTSSDYTLNKNDNKCYKTFELDAMYKYTCPNDYDNYGEICVKK